MTDAMDPAALLDTDEDERAIVELMAQLRDLPDDEATDALRWWVRSPWWHPLHMILGGWQGELARRAYRILKRDLAADTPGRRWDAIDATMGRASIIRLLGLENHPARFYAADAFKIWRDDDGRDWIAGAIGSRPWADNKAAAAWQHFDIRDVILWDPRTNDARIAGEHRSTSTFVMPDQPAPKLRVWGDCAAFFRAWAAERAKVGMMLHRRAKGEWKHPVAEATDGALPGALLIGEAIAARWPANTAASIVAEDGVTVSELHFAVARASGMPHFERA